MEHNEISNKRDELRRGVMVFIALAVLTAIEYFIATHAAPRAFLWLIALIKAGLVLWFFMHLKRAFTEGEH